MFACMDFCLVVAIISPPITIIQSLSFLDIEKQKEVF